MAEHFGFHENFCVGEPNLIGKYKPDPGEVVVEVYDDTDQVLTIENFQSGVEAPRSAILVDGLATTIHIDGAARGNLEWRCDPDAILPFDIPPYIIEKPKVSYLRLWWGSKLRESLL